MFNILKLIFGTIILSAIGIALFVATPLLAMFGTAIMVVVGSFFLVGMFVYDDYEEKSKGE